MSSNSFSQPPKQFKDTLNLPKTDFPIRAQPAVEDPLMLERWEKEKLAERVQQSHQGAPLFVLHDGPPYANGPIHLGHAYNKILKDIITKTKRMAGFHVPVTPGFDCHGLPIELRVTKEQGGKDISRIELMKQCRMSATQWINNQTESFKKLGVFFDWDHPYITMSPSYESETVRAFGKLVRDGFIERKFKSVPWCSSCKTVLASAEIEYEDRKDPSLYVLFKLNQADVQTLFPQHHFSDSRVSFIVWTTTPWTLPLNRAVMLRPKADYVVIELSSGKYGVVGAEVADKVCALLSIEKKIVARVTAEQLEGKQLSHPFVDRTSPIILDDSVGLDEGTAAVHCAPGCGPADYEAGVKNKLEIFCPVAADGVYTSEVLPAQLTGISVSQAIGPVIKLLQEHESLLFKGSITHSYPHCWRCHNPLIFRATPQWFFNLEKKDVTQRALRAIDDIQFIPERSKNFLRATVESRWEWCLSRQRIWGSPIPALVCNQCGYAHLQESIIEKVAVGIARDGIEYWQTVSIPELVGADFVCPQCGSSDIKKEQDILDVWFDSGISHYVVLFQQHNKTFPADLYLEGQDQHRGWFQSSLMTSLVLEGTPCTKAIMTHGYTVDEKGQKMSKSLGNVVAAEDIIKKMGTDGLRLWVASIDHEHDLTVSENVLQNVAEVHRKIRNTGRFLLSNLFDFDAEKDLLSPDQLLPLDYYALLRCHQLNEEVQHAYASLDTTAVFHLLADYCAVELSSFYLDVVKDRLYVERPAGRERRSAQTVLWHILDTLTRLIAPILSFTAEHMFDHYQKNKKDSIHEKEFVPVQPLTQKEQELMNRWDMLKKVRSALLKAIELEREKGIIKHPLEAQLTIFIDDKNADLAPVLSYFSSLKNTTPEALLKELMVVSQVTRVASSADLDTTMMQGVSVRVERAAGSKCPRCWQWEVTQNPDGLCVRCQELI